MLNFLQNRIIFLLPFSFFVYFLQLIGVMKGLVPPISNLSSPSYVMYYSTSLSVLKFLLQTFLSYPDSSEISYSLSHSYYSILPSSFVLYMLLLHTHPHFAFLHWYYQMYTKNVITFCTSLVFLFPSSVPGRIFNVTIMYKNSTFKN